MSPECTGSLVPQSPIGRNASQTVEVVGAEMAGKRGKSEVQQDDRDLQQLKQLIPGLSSGANVSQVRSINSGIATR